MKKEESREGDEEVKKRREGMQAGRRKQLKLRPCRMHKAKTRRETLKEILTEDSKKQTETEKGEQNGEEKIIN